MGRNLGRLVLSSVILACSIVALVSCGTSGSAPGQGSASAPGADSSAGTNDPKLIAAADELLPILEKSFPDSYAGLTLDSSRHILTIYRRPDPALDRAALKKTSGIHVVFHDARWSLTAMQGLADKIMADKRYWETQNVNIQTTAASVEGQGVEVGTLRGDAADAVKLYQHYGREITISVSKIAVAPA